jgi:hypothetical protein
MASRQLEAEIDRLYQLPLEEFTAARNALARTAGAGASPVRQLSKPSVAAWAVNQVYGKRRDVYDALIDASLTLRKTHKTILAGRRADLREPSRAHEEALDAALKAALTILQEAGHPASDTTRQAVLTTLRALPSDETPGRLTATLQPGGFEMLQGLSIGGSSGVIRPRTTATPIDVSRAGSPKIEKRKPELTRAEAAKAEALRAEAAKALREAEQNRHRQEFEVTRAARESERAARQVEKAREALANAQQMLDDAEIAAKEAIRSRDAAAERAKESERELEAARQRYDALRKS